MTYLITSATRLSAANLALAAQLATKHLEVSGKPTVKIDPALLAGVIIQHGDQVLDLSLAGKLTRLAKSL
ncbi:MAG: ATP synthase subunit delta [Microgenomates group bacterium GW2011_GWA1_46_7]|jgi:F-type H+-transporting ATPase subunit delta|nr:MAG: ATP synthase subunit delta [Microgenomates group bacterium GW2011_GWA1_46_7]